MATKKMIPAQKTSRKTKLEKQYEELFTPIFHIEPIPDNYSLAQPSPYENVISVVTNGAYEEPIIG